MKIIIQPQGTLAIYEQIVNQLKNAIVTGELKEGEALPSIRGLAGDLNVSVITTKRAYEELEKDGLIRSVAGKGFYVCGVGNERPLRILLLFDKLSSYKQVLFQSFMDKIGGDAEVTIRIHNQNLDVFEFFIDEDVDHFDYYVVAPHFPLDAATTKRKLKLLKRFPYRKLILLDRYISELTGNYGAIYQDFTSDIAGALEEGLDKLKTFSKLNVLMMPNSLYSAEISGSVKKFCDEHSLPVEFHTGVTKDIIRPNEVYLLLNSQQDDGLLSLSRTATKLGLKIGEDISVISYNDSPINELILNGLTAASTDFRQMGERAANMILERNLRKEKCDFRLIRRGTF